MPDKIPRGEYKKIYFDAVSCPQGLQRVKPLYEVSGGALFSRALAFV